MHSLHELVSETVVMKFGGSSVADPEKIRQVAGRVVAAHEEGLRVVATVSAMGRTTDGLLELARRVSADPDPRELDMLLSTGGRAACALVAMAINDLGHEAVSYAGSQAGILTDAVYTDAKIIEITPTRVLEALLAGKIVLVAGFQGFSREAMDVTTLGRGGTDVTAVALAAALGSSCEVYSDRAGVLTADPGVVPEARKLPVVSYATMLEMASSGAEVVTARAVELARSRGVRIHVRSIHSDDEGTWIEEAPEGERSGVEAVTHSESEVVFALSRLPNRPGAAATVLDAVAAEHVDVGTILQLVGPDTAGELGLSVSKEDVVATRRALERAQEIGAVEVEEIAGLGMVSLVGAGIRSRPEVGAEGLRALAAEGISPRLVATAPVRISWMIGRDEVLSAVRALHDAFALGVTGNQATE